MEKTINGGEGEGGKKNKKTEAKMPPEKEKRPLTNLGQWCKMEVHTVGVCRLHISPFNKDILPQK